MELYGSPPQHHSVSSRKSKSRKARPKSHERNFDQKSIQQTNGDEVEESQTDGVSS
eukprot:CAMPEP_0201935974 /NCGR_PEP_ID=MMETSP0903-20130614/36583_1 /ASSEMBLY_ACC=CAM_ASM_000552 /TAXON_ID=420261 /ORGANISM="Thalassiosira antarctica, Strain CCMP982" /LENGTH=55 /DNA_ID=CAMNT_0048476553 /DNA_START=31 /DNA_END=195 /DNA_ORIENTATION=-